MHDEVNKALLANMAALLARFAHLGTRTTRRFSGGDASLGARTTRRFSGGDASLHRSAITQHLWALRDGAFAPPPPRADGSRVPAHSRVCVDYKLTSDAELRSRYESAFGTLRVGRLLEDMDALAGSVAFLHVDDGDAATDPPILVTASMEKMELVDERLSLDEDYALVGQLAWAGRSSLEIAAELRRADGAAALRAVFTFVARKADGSGAAAVPPLVPETADERARHAAAAAKQAARKARRAAAARAPDDDDGAAVDALLGPGRVARDFPGQADDGCVPMASTSLRNALMCHPQERNTAGRVFGGVLMRRALELAFATAFSYGGAAPLTKALDRVDFVRPVDVGSLLALKSHVVFAEGTTMHVDVSAAVWRPDKRESTLTNTFSFVFTVDGPRPLKRVLPSTRAEARLQLAAMARATEP